MQGPGIDTAFEINHLVDRPPEVHPARPIEFRFVTQIETDRIRRCHESQHEPALLLAYAQWFAVAADVLVGQPVSQPVAGDAQQFHIVGTEANLFPQLPEHRLLRFLADQHTALRKLPAFAANTAGEHQFATVVRKDYADVCAESFVVNPVAIHRNRIRILYCP